MSNLTELCKSYGPTLEKVAPWLDGECLLKAIAMNESSLGAYNLPRFEKAYSYNYNGLYANRDLWKRYGDWAAMSYSSWQIMYPTAVELGFTGSPIDLWHDATAINYVVELIKRRIIAKGATEIKQVFDAYNSGSFKDLIVPKDYIEKGCKNYEMFRKSKYGITDT